MALTERHVLADQPLNAVSPDPSAARLVDRLRVRAAHVGMLGLGYTGLPMAVELARAGFHVTEPDVDQARVDAVSGGRSPVTDVDDLTIMDLTSDGYLRASSPLELLAEADVALIVVLTPLTDERKQDARYILSAARSIAAHLHPGMLVVLQSTYAPGTTREVLLPVLEESSGLSSGREIFVVRCGGALADANTVCC